MRATGRCREASGRTPVALAAVLAGLAAAGPAHGVSAGAARVVITPGDGVPMAGYYHQRLAEGTLDDLFAKAVVFGEGDGRAAIVGLDLITTHRAFVEEARRLAGERTGIPPERILIGATHAHTGPVLVEEGSRRSAALGGASAEAARFTRELPARIAAAVAEADGRRVEARVSVARGEVDGLAFNRRFHMKDGGFAWNPGKGNPKILRAAGPVDPGVPVVFVESADGVPIALSVNYAMHLDTVGGLQWSADFPAALGEILGLVHGDAMVTQFTIGCAGDVNHIDVRWRAPQKGAREAARIGSILGGAVVQACRLLTPVEEDGVVCLSRRIELELPAVTAEEVAAAEAVLGQGGDDRRVPFLDLVEAYKILDVADRGGRPHGVEIQVIALGRDVAWVSLPGEIFVELGIALKRASPFAHTIPVALANGSVGYIPTRQAFAQGQYEVVSSRCAPGAGEHLVEAATALLREAFAEAAAGSGEPQ